MLKITTILLIIIFLTGPITLPAYSESTTMVVEAKSTLSLAVPDSTSYALSSPLKSGEEVISKGERVILEGNNFQNAPEQAYITVTLFDTVPNAELALRNIFRDVAEGDVMVNPSSPEQIVLSNIPSDYALPGQPQEMAFGTIACRHELVIIKKGTVPAGTYRLMLLWTASDGSG